MSLRCQRRFEDDRFLELLDCWLNAFALGLVGGVVGHRAEYVATQSLNACLGGAAGRLETGARGAGGGAGAFTLTHILVFSLYFKLFD